MSPLVLPPPGTGGGDTDREREPVSPWKAMLSPAASVAPRLAPFGNPAPVPHGPPAAMGLQFELRELTPRTNARWRGPTARPLAELTPGHGQFRLAVRPVLQSASGNWVRATLTWAQLSFQVNRLNVLPEQYRWLCEFSALHRAVRGVYTSQDPEWIHLDDFTSPLLWPLFADADRLGVTLVGAKKTTAIVIGKTASIALDASYPRPGGDLVLTPTLHIDDLPHPPEQAGPLGTHGVYSFALTPHPVFTLAPTTETLSPEQLRLLGRPSSAVVPAAEVAEFLTDYSPRLQRAIQLTSTDASVHFPEAASSLLTLSARFGPRHSLTLEWAWEDHEGARDSSLERALLARVEAALNMAPVGALPAELPPPVTLRGIDAAEFAANILPRLTDLPGVRVDVSGTPPDYRELTGPPEFTITTVESEQRDWFDLGVIVSIEGKSVPFGPLFTALTRGHTKLLLIDNSYLSLRHPAFERLRELIDEAGNLQEWEAGPRINRYQASLWADFEDLAEDTQQAQTWRAAVTGLLDTTAVTPAALPAGVQAILRPYQLDGFHWLAFLWKHQLGGILADDMGLGKTLQALTLMLHATHTPPPGYPNSVPADRRPFLVVAPTSVVSNWQTEAARFTPELTVHQITATQAKAGVSIADAAVGADVVLTSYALFRLDFAAYQAHGWAGLILDEAQFVKNRSARVHGCAKDLNTPFKLAITGTPMENNLLELWALFSIVAPGLFASGRKFTEDFVRPISAGDRPELLAKLRRRIRPLLMRRTKELVAPELPPKQEQVLQIELNPRHRKLYDTVLQRERQKLLGLIDELDKNRFIIFRSLTLLRMLSLDPALVDEKYAAIPSSKLDALFEQLDDVVAEGHRALIFSQFTSFLALAAARLDAAGIAYCYLDGATQRRSEVIDSFKTGADPVFLISLKAGGFGLNLTEADYVFLLDPWWNPATEAQAVDRTHRIGQAKNVMVYRLVATGTIEEKVMALKERKAKLFDAVLDDDAVFSAALTADDIRGLLAPPAG